MEVSVRDLAGAVFIAIMTFLIIKVATSSDIWGFLAFVCVLAFANKDLRVFIKAIFKK